MSAPATHRPLPASLDAEKGVLCSIIREPSLPACVEVLKSIKTDHFHHPAHDTIWRGIHELRDKGKTIDLVNLTQVLADWNLLEQIGGACVLTDLHGFLPTAYAVSEYAATV